MTLLGTKLHPPATRSDLLPRRRLIDRLEAGAERALTLVTAPAGYGKTTLVVQWLEEADRSVPAAWLSLDDGDRDPERFLGHLVAAIRRIRPDAAAAAHGLLRSPEATGRELVLTALVNGLAESETSLRLVLDDYHVIDSPPVHEALTFLLDHLPPTIHLVITSRSDPPLSLSRLRVRGQLSELREADLRFSVEETAAFLNERMGLVLSAEQIDALERRTEGWVASLQLAGLALKAIGDAEAIARFLDDFTGGHHYIVDYLMDEVLDRCDDETRSFLYKTVILDRICGPLCDAVTERAGGQTMLERLEREHVFVIPLDTQRRWYRYHHLFADALRQHPDRDAGPADRRSFHRRAARWFHARPGLMDEAIRHALAAGDEAEAADWLSDSARATLWARGEASRLREQIEGLPSSTLAERPELLAYHAWTLYFTGEPEAAESEMARALSRVKKRDEEDERGLVTGLAAALDAFVSRASGELERTIELSRESLARLGDRQSTLRAILLFNLGAALDHSGALDAAVEVAEELLALTAATGDTYLRLEAMNGLAGLAEERADLHRAEAISLDALRAAERDAPGLAAIAHATLARLHHQWNRLESADEHALRAIELARRTGLRSVLIHSFYRRALIDLARGGGAIADGARERIRKLAARESIPLVRELYGALLAELDLRLGDVEAAEGWLRQTGGLDVPLPERSSHAEAHVMLVVTWISIERCRRQTQPEPLSRTIRRLRQIDERMAAIGRTHLRIRALLQLALAEDLRGEAEAALAALAEALALAEPAGYCRAIVDHGPPMRSLLERARAADVRPGYASRLLDALAEAERARADRRAGASVDDGTGASVAEPAALLEPLHEQELAILRLMAAGMTNREIAEERYLSVNTVKWYVKRMYERLDVHNRVEAVSRGRALGLILER